MRGRPVARADAAPAMGSPRSGAIPWPQHADGRVGFVNASAAPPQKGPQDVGVGSVPVMRESDSSVGF